MTLRDLLTYANENDEVERLAREAARAPQRALVSASLRPFLIAALLDADAGRAPALVVAPDDRSARDLALDIRFGVGADLDEAAWRGVFRQLVALGLARVDHESHGALKLGEASRAVLKGEQAVQMRRVLARKRVVPVAASVPAAALTPADVELLEKLKGWRRHQALAQGVPAYVIFHDSTLGEIAQRRPRDLAGLAGVGGIGVKKLERYGAALLEVLRTG